MSGQGGDVAASGRSAGHGSGNVKKMFVVAWVFSLAFYFLQYAVRSAPSVMMDELSQAFGLTTAGLGSLLGLYYYTYSLCALVSGAFLDRWGAKYTIPAGALILAVGIGMFGLDVSWMASVGRLLQGAGAAFAFVGAVYLATHGLPGKYLATAIGVTQCAGMLGGAMGQSMVAQLIHGVVTWRAFWIDTGIVTALLAVALCVVTPGSHDVPVRAGTAKGARPSMFAPYRIVLSNPQSWLCGLCSGLLFLPTTVGSMTWGVSFLTHGWGLDYHAAVERAAMVPLGWVVGCPLLGYVADRLGRRKPVLFGGIAVMAVAVAAIVFLPPQTFPPYVLAFTLGFASGAAMIPYTIIKEVNPDEVKGSATGAINFIVFVMSALVSPMFSSLLQKLSGGGTPDEAAFTHAFSLGLVCIVGGGLLALRLRETGKGVAAAKV